MAYFNLDCNMMTMNLLSQLLVPRHNLFTWSSVCRGSDTGYLELPVRRTAWTAVNCQQFQTVLKLVFAEY